MTLYYSILNASYCTCFFVVEDNLESVCYISLSSSPSASPELFEDARARLKTDLISVDGSDLEKDTRFQKTKEQIKQLVESPGKPSQLTYSQSGTEFQKKVWDYLVNCTSPGSVMSYSDIADGLELPRTSSRAIGTAVGANKLAIIVPCHRILRRDGHLGGYRWGIDLKQKILALEGYNVK
jgi:O-6-methylguanine DNA methyltransferase